jgi:MFS family permease
MPVDVGATIATVRPADTCLFARTRVRSLTKTFAPLVSLLAGVAFLLCGNALLGTMIPLRGLHEHFTPVIIGLMGSSYNLGFVVGCLACPYLILRAGHIRAYSTLVSLAAATTLIHPMVVDPMVWIGARAITGFCLAGLYLIIESWLNDRASNDNRGLIMSVYIVVNFLTTTAGQLMVLLAPIEHFELFAAASLLVSLAVVPVALTTSAQPAPIAIVQFRPLRLLKIAPVGLTGTFMIGIANGAFWSLVTVFAIGRGMSPGGAAIFLSIAVIGGALMQWPVGRLSDAVDRRLVLAVVMVLSATASLFTVLLPFGISGLFVMAFLLGMVVLTSYSVAAAHAYDRAEKSAYVEMATGVLLANGVGAVFGPLIASFAMERWGDGSLFVFMAIVELMLAGFIALRWRIRPSRPDDPKETFEIFSTAPVGGAIPPEAPAPNDPILQTPVVPAPESKEPAEADSP